MGGPTKPTSVRRVPLKPIYFLLRIHQETFDTKRKYRKSLNLDTNFFHLSIRVVPPFLTQEFTKLESLRQSWLAFSGLARSAGTVVFPLGLGESVLVFPLTTRLTLHLFCR